MKKVIGYIIIVLLFAGSIAGIYFGIKYNGVKNDKANIDAYKQQIEELTNNVKDLTSDIEDLESLVASQEEAITGLTGDKAELEATITSLNETISSLTAQVEEYQSQIETLNSTIASKDELLEEYSSTIANLQSQIESLNATISNLNNMITYYEELIASYDFAGKSIITFKVKDNVYDVIVAESDETFHYDVTDPSLIGYTFTGWSSDNETTIDLQSTTFPQDTTLYALFEEKAETFTVNSSATIRTTDHTSTPLNFNTYIDITGSTVNNVELLTYASPALLDITEPLSDFTTVKDSSIEIVIPMSFISENYPDLVPSIESDTYFKAVYSCFGDEFILTDFDWYIKFNHAEYEYNYSSEITSSEEVKYITSLNSKVYNLTKTDMFSRDEYVVTLSENEDGIVLTCEDQELSYTKSTSNMYFVNETIDDTLIQFTFGINEDYTISIIWVNNTISGGDISVTEKEESEEPTDPENPEEPEFAVLEGYTFSGDRLVSYTGTETDIVIPSSYSISVTENVELTFNDQFELLDYALDLMDIAYPFPLTVTDSNNQEHVFNSDLEILDNSNVVYPIKTIGVKIAFIEGDDYQVTIIADYAFENCNNLTAITIPDSVTTIGNRIFDGCSSLTSITIGNGVTSINKSAFQGCYSITSIEVDQANTQYISEDGVLFNKDKTILVKYPGGNTRTSYQIPDSVTTIEDYAFEACNNLTSITFGDNSLLTSIGYWAFNSCKNLTSIILPDELTTIESRAFRWCSSLTSIVIPSKVESIGSFAFENCDSLTEITLLPTVPPPISSNILPTIITSIYVPNDSVESYKTAWSRYAIIIKSIDELEVA